MMPSTEPARRLKPGLLLRIGAACVSLALVGAVLVGFELLLFGVASYGVLTVTLGAVESVVPDPATAMVLTVLVFAGLTAVVYAASRATRAAPAAAKVTPQLLLYASSLLVVASLVVTYWIIDLAGLPTWVFLIVVLVLIASLYPMIGLRAAGEWGRGESESDVWSAEYEDGDGWNERSAQDDVRAIAGAMRRAVSDVVDTAGVAGTLALVVLAVASLGLVYVGAQIHSQSTMLRWLSAAASLLLAGYHLGRTLRAELRRSAVRRDLAADLGETVGESRRDPVQQRVVRLAAQTDVPPPTVQLHDSTTPLAAAVGYSPSSSTLVVTTGLVDALADRELDAVLAHELAHVANRDAAVMTALSFPRAAAHEAFYRYGLNPVVALLAGVAALSSRFCTAVVARAREYAADDGAVAISGEPTALASALETLDTELDYRPTTDLRNTSAAAFSVVPPPWEEHPFFDRTRRLIYRGLLGTHPPTKRRIERLESMEARLERDETRRET